MAQICHISVLFGANRVRDRVAVGDLRRIPNEQGEESAKVRVAVLARRQFGLVARRQLAALGIGDMQILRWARGAFLHRRLPGVYAVGHTAPWFEADLSAALLYAGPGAMLSHGSAAGWLGLISGRPPIITVRTPRRCRSRERVEVHDRRELPRAWHRGLPCAPVPWVLLDYAATADSEQVRRALAEAEFRGLLELDSLKAVLGHGRPGSAQLRLALARHEPSLAVTRSELERLLLAVCRRAGLPLPEFNVTIEGLLVDAAWRRERVIVEVDGRASHQSWAQIQRDRDRDLKLRAAGWLVLRYVWRQLRTREAQVAADLAAALARA